MPVPLSPSGAYLSPAPPAAATPTFSTIFTTVAMIMLSARRVDATADATDVENLLLLFGPGTTTTPTSTTVTAPPACVHMNDVLWEYRHDATTRPLVKAIFAFFYSMIIVFGVLGNLCVILSISRTKSLQTVPNMFIFSLSCSDIVVCCTSATITPITAFQKEWLFGAFLCSVAPFIAGVSLCFSTFTLAAISLDRFMLIRFPMKKPFSHAQAFLIICLACALAAALSLPIVFMQQLRPIDKYCGAFCYEDWGAAHSQRRAYGTVMLTLQFIIPLSVIVFCYTAISVRLGQSLILKSKHGAAHQWQLQMTEQQRAATKRRQRTNRMFIGMVVAFSASWIWTLLFNVARDYEVLPDFVKRQEFFFGIITHCIAMTSTVWNPLLYALLNLQLRAAFVQLMPRALRRLFGRDDCAPTMTRVGAKASSPNRVPLVGDSTRLLLQRADANGVIVGDGSIINGNDFTSRKASRAAIIVTGNGVFSVSETPFSSSDASLDEGSAAVADVAHLTATIFERKTTASEHDDTQLGTWQNGSSNGYCTGQQQRREQQHHRQQQRRKESGNSTLAKYGSFDVVTVAHNCPVLISQSTVIANAAADFIIDQLKTETTHGRTTVLAVGSESVKLGDGAAAQCPRSAQRERSSNELGGRVTGRGGGGRQRVAAAWRRLADRRHAAVRSDNGGASCGDDLAGSPGSERGSTDFSTDGQLGLHLAGRLVNKGSPTQCYGNATDTNQFATDKSEEIRTSWAGKRRRANISPAVADSVFVGAHKAPPSLSFDASDVPIIPIYRGAYREGAVTVGSAESPHGHTANSRRRYYCPECRHNFAGVCELNGSDCCAPSSVANRRTTCNIKPLNVAVRPTLSQPQSSRTHTPQSSWSAIAATLKSVRSTPLVVRKSLSFRGGGGTKPRRVHKFVNRLSLVALSGGDEMLFSSGAENSSGTTSLSTFGNGDFDTRRRREDFAEQHRPLINDARCGSDESSSPID